MTGTPLRLVIGASAGIQLCIEEDHSQAVTEIFARVEGERPLALHVPDCLGATTERSSDLGGL